MQQTLSAQERPDAHCEVVAQAPPWGTGVGVAVTVPVAVTVGVTVGVLVGVVLGVFVGVLVGVFVTHILSAEHDSPAWSQHSPPHTRSGGQQVSPVQTKVPGQQMFPHTCAGPQQPIDVQTWPVVQHSTSEPVLHCWFIGQQPVTEQTSPVRAALLSVVAAKCVRRAALSVAAASFTRKTCRIAGSVDH